MKIYLLAPNYCWHTSDLLELNSYNKKLQYIFVADTPPFISREIFKRYLGLLHISYEFFQRIWRIFLFIPWGIYLSIKLRGKKPIHCHGLFALVIARFAKIDGSRIIFTPQGSDLLILPKKNVLVRKFLEKNLFLLKYITADSNLLLNKSLEICPRLNKNKLKLIQNGIPLEKIRNLVKSKIPKKIREIDICWIRGFGENYQFEYFLLLIEKLSFLTNSPLNVSIISAYGSKVIPKNIFEFRNINIHLLPRLTSDKFLKSIFNSKVIVSIPLSDSSPRSVYESIFLGCKLFVTKLDCLNWIPKDLKNDFIYSSNDLKKDAEQILYALDNFNEKKDLQNFPDKFKEFTNNLKYSKIAQSYYEVFEKIN